MAILTIWPKEKYIIGILIMSSWIFNISAIKVNQRLLPSNKIIDLKTSCSAHKFSMNVTMEKPFKGVVFAKDFPFECRSLGSFEETISLELPTSGCGVRLASMFNTSEDGSSVLRYMVTVVVQMDRHLRQITDQEQTVTCVLDDEETKLNSNAMRQLVMDSMKKIRTGRMNSNGHSAKYNHEVDDDVQLQILDKSRAWMELTGDSETSYNDDIVQVGDSMTLTIKSTLPANIGWRVINCMAHDGIGDSSQKLLDDFGCPIDEQILNELTLSSPRMIGSNTNKLITKKATAETVWSPRGKRSVVKKTGEELGDYGSDLVQKQMRYQEASTKFPAFKFPDRDRLHLSCGLQLCKGDCQKIDCKALRRSSRHLQKSDALLRRKSMNISDDVVDTLEVYNSVEVYAPEIELEDYRSGRKRPKKNKTKLITSIPGDRTFCVSTNKMALAFCMLGLMFIVAIVVAIISLLRSRRKDNRSYYSRSVFSGSTSTGSGFGGSRLLLHESPCMGPQQQWQCSGRSF